MCDCDFANMNFFILLLQNFVLINFMKLREIENAFKISFPVRLLLVMKTFDFRFMVATHPILLR